MEGSLKNSALSGAKWNFIANGGKYFITFFLSIILARLLEPEEFGLIGMLSIFIAIATVFVDSGLNTALVRSNAVSQEDYATVFYFNILISIGFYFLLFFTAPLIADFYHEPILIILTRLISLIFVINSFGLIQNTILIRELNFKKQSICYLSGLLASVLISVIMAFMGFGVYSIVAQAVSQALVTNILLWFTSTWKPSGGFNRVSFKKLWAFGSNVLGSNIVSRVIDNIDNLLIGKVFSAGQLGFYVRAKSTKQIPELILTQVLNAVSFPVLTKVQDNNSEFRRLHIQFYKLAIYIFFPIVFGLIAMAKAFIVVLYSSKWLPSVPLLQIITLSSIAYFLAALFSQTILAKGNAKLYFKLNSIKKVLGLLSIPFGLFWGLVPFLWAIVIISFICLVLDFYFVSRLIDIPFMYYPKALITPLVLSVIMGCAVYSITYLPINSYLLLLSLQVFTGLLVYIVLSLLFRVKEFYYFKDVAKEQFSSLMRKFSSKK